MGDELKPTSLNPPAAFTAILATTIVVVSGFKFVRSLAQFSGHSTTGLQSKTELSLLAAELLLEQVEDASWSSSSLSQI